MVKNRCRSDAKADGNLFESVAVLSHLGRAQGLDNCQFRLLRTGAASNKTEAKRVSNVSRGARPFKVSGSVVVLDAVDVINRSAGWRVSEKCRGDQSMHLPVKDHSAGKQPDNAIAVFVGVAPNWRIAAKPANMATVAYLVLETSNPLPHASKAT